MSLKNVEKFFVLVKNNENIAKELIKIKDKLQQKDKIFDEAQFVKDEIISLAQKNGIDFTPEEFLNYVRAQISELSDEDLIDVSGGGSFQNFLLGGLLVALSSVAPAVGISSFPLVEPISQKTNQNSETSSQTSQSGGDGEETSAKAKTDSQKDKSSEKKADSRKKSSKKVNRNAATSKTQSNSANRPRLSSRRRAAQNGSVVSARLQRDAENLNQPQHSTPTDVSSEHSVSNGSEVSQNNSVKSFTSEPQNKPTPNIKTDVVTPAPAPAPVVNPINKNGPTHTPPNVTPINNKTSPEPAPVPEPVVNPNNKATPEPAPNPVPAPQPNIKPEPAPQPVVVNPELDELSTEKFEELANYLKSNFDVSDFEKAEVDIETENSLVEFLCNSKVTKNGVFIHDTYVKDNIAKTLIDFGMQKYGFILEENKTKFTPYLDTVKPVNNKVEPKSDVYVEWTAERARALANYLRNNFSLGTFNEAVLDSETENSLKDFLYNSEVTKKGTFIRGVKIDNEDAAVLFNYGKQRYNFALGTNENIRDDVVKVLIANKDPESFVNFAESMGYDGLNILENLVKIWREMKSNYEYTEYPQLRGDVYNSASQFISKAKKLIKAKNSVNKKNKDVIHDNEAPVVNSSFRWQRIAYWASALVADAALAYLGCTYGNVIYNTVKAYVVSLFNNSVPLSEMFSKTVTYIKNLFSSNNVDAPQLSANITANSISNAAENMTKAANGMFLKNPGETVKIVKNTFDAAANSTNPGAIASTISEGVKIAANTLTQQGVQAAGSGAANLASTAAQGALNSFAEVGKNSFSTQKIDAPGLALVQYGKNVIKGVGNALGSLGSQALGKVKNVAESVYGMLPGNPVNSIEIHENTFSPQTKEAAKLLSKTLQKGMQKVDATGLASLVKSGENTIKGAGNAIGSLGGQALDKVKSMLNTTANTEPFTVPKLPIENLTYSIKINPFAENSISGLGAIDLASTAGKDGLNSLVKIGESSFETGGPINVAKEVVDSPLAFNYVPLNMIKEAGNAIGSLGGQVLDKGENIVKSVYETLTENVGNTSLPQTKEDLELLCKTLQKGRSLKNQFDENLISTNSSLNMPGTSLISSIKNFLIDNKISVVAIAGLCVLGGVLYWGYNHFKGAPAQAQVPDANPGDPPPAAGAAGIVANPGGPLPAAGAAAQPQGANENSESQPQNLAGGAFNGENLDGQPEDADGADNNNHNDDGNNDNSKKAMDLVQNTDYTKYVLEEDAWLKNRVIAFTEYLDKTFISNDPAIKDTIPEVIKDNIFTLKKLSKVKKNSKNKKDGGIEINTAIILEENFKILQKFSQKLYSPSCEDTNSENELIKFVLFNETFEFTKRETQNVADGLRKINLNDHTDFIKSEVNRFLKQAKDAAKGVDADKNDTAANNKFTVQISDEDKGSEEEEASDKHTSDHSSSDSDSDDDNSASEGEENNDTSDKEEEAAGGGSTNDEAEISEKNNNDSASENGSESIPSSDSEKFEGNVSTNENHKAAMSSDSEQKEDEKSKNNDLKSGTKDFSFDFSSSEIMSETSDGKATQKNDNTEKDNKNEAVIILDSGEHDGETEGVPEGAATTITDEEKVQGENQEEINAEEKAEQTEENKAESDNDTKEENEGANIESAYTTEDPLNANIVDGDWTNAGVEESAAPANLVLPDNKNKSEEKNTVITLADDEKSKGTNVDSSRNEDKQAKIKTEENNDVKLYKETSKEESKQDKKEDIKPKSTLSSVQSKYEPLDLLTARLLPQYLQHRKPNDLNTDPKMDYLGHKKNLERFAGTNDVNENDKNPVYYFKDNKSGEYKPLEGEIIASDLYKGLSYCQVLQKFALELFPELCNKKESSSANEDEERSNSDNSQNENIDAENQEGEETTLTNDNAEKSKKDENIEDKGFCGNSSVNNGENVKWTLYKDGQLKIYGNGPMANYEKTNNTPWFGHIGIIKSIVISGKVSSIGNLAFSGCSCVDSISMPESVTSIGSAAFYSCTSIKSIAIPNSVTSIGDNAFYGCTSLESIDIPSNVKSIGSGAFQRCTSLSNVKLAEGLVSIGSFAFSYCESLKDITIPGSVTSIGEHAFSYCSNLDTVTYDGEYNPAKAESEDYSKYGGDNTYEEGNADGQSNKYYDEFPSTIDNMVVDSLPPSDPDDTLVNLFTPPKPREVPVVPMIYVKSNYKSKYFGNISLELSRVSPNFKTPPTPRKGYTTPTKSSETSYNIENSEGVAITPLAGILQSTDPKDENKNIAKKITFSGSSSSDEEKANKEVNDDVTQDKAELPETSGEQIYNVEEGEELSPDDEKTWRQIMENFSKEEGSTNDGEETSEENNNDSVSTIKNKENYSESTASSDFEQKEDEKPSDKNNNDSTTTNNTEKMSDDSVSDLASNESEREEVYTIPEDPDVKDTKNIAKNAKKAHSNIMGDKKSPNLSNLDSDKGFSDSASDSVGSENDESNQVGDVGDVGDAESKRNFFKGKTPEISQKVLDNAKTNNTEETADDNVSDLGSSSSENENENNESNQVGDVESKGNFPEDYEWTYEKVEKLYKNLSQLNKVRSTNTVVEPNEDQKEEARSFYDKVSIDFSSKSQSITPIYTIDKVSIEDRGMIDVFQNSRHYSRRYFNPDASDLIKEALNAMEFSEDAECLCANTKSHFGEVDGRGAIKIFFDTLISIKENGLPKDYPLSAKNCFDNYLKGIQMKIGKNTLEEIKEYYLKL